MTSPELMGRVLWLRRLHARERRTPVQVRGGIVPTDAGEWAAVIASYARPTSGPGPRR